MDYQELECVQYKFASIIGGLCGKPKIMSQFAVWLDLRLAEYKLKGSIELECTGIKPDPKWLDGLKPEPTAAPPQPVPNTMSSGMSGEITWQSVSDRRLSYDQTSSPPQKIKSESPETADVSTEPVYPVSLHSHRLGSENLGQPDSNHARGRLANSSRNKNQHVVEHEQAPVCPAYTETKRKLIDSDYQTSAGKIKKLISPDIEQVTDLSECDIVPVNDSLVSLIRSSTDDSLTRSSNDEVTVYIDNETDDLLPESDNTSQGLVPGGECRRYSIHTSCTGSPDVDGSESSPPESSSDFISHVPVPTLHSEFPSSISSSSSFVSSLSSCPPPVSQNWLASFQIPYHKFPPELLAVCDRGERPKDSLRREMVRILCAEISQHTRLPGKKNIEYIAALLVGRYPNSFADLVGMEILGTGHAGLVSQIIDRMANAYGRGMAKKGSVVVNSSSEIDVTKRMKAADSYGCINFQPTELPEFESEESLLGMKEFLKAEYLKLPEDRNVGEIKNCMQQTYILQRRLINRTIQSTIEELHNEWPLLFEAEHLLEHFRELTGISLYEQLEESLREKAKRLLRFIVVKKLKTKGVKEWVSSIKAAGGLDEGSHTLSAVFLVLATALGEDSTRLLHIFEETTNIEEVERQAECFTPHIAVIGDLFKPTSSFILVIEKKAVSRVESLDMALAVTFASYYVFNLQYDGAISASLEFIQRCFVNLNPAKGSKSQSKKTGIASNKREKMQPVTHITCTYSCLHQFLGEVYSETEREYQELRQYNRPRCGLVPPKIAEQFHMIELTPGSGVYVFPEQFTEAKSKRKFVRRSENGSQLSKDIDGGAMARYLMKCFWSSKEIIGASISNTPVHDKKVLCPAIIQSIIGAQFCVFNVEFLFGREDTIFIWLERTLSVNILHGPQHVYQINSETGHVE